MALAHDKDGFLVGQTKRNIDTVSYGKHLALLREIRADGAAMRDDVSVIRRALTNPAFRVPKPIAAPVLKSVAGGNAQIKVTGQAGSNPSNGNSNILQIRNNQTVAMPRRADGRFAKQHDRMKEADDSEAHSADPETKSTVASSVKEAIGEIGRSAAEMISNTDQIDPALTATKEIKDVFAPALQLFKPLGGLFRRKDSEGDAEKAAGKSVPWYRRMWGELRELNKKNGKGGAGVGLLLGGLAALASLIVRFSGLGMLTKLIGGLVGGLGIPGIGRGLPGWGSGRNAPKNGGGTGKGSSGGAIGRYGKAALRRLPLIGGLVAGGSALYSMFGGGDQTKAQRYAGAGSGIGALIGGALGTMAGPIGTIAGATIGDIVGEKVGKWLSEVKWSDVVSRIAGVWDSTKKAADAALVGAGRVISSAGRKAEEIKDAAIVQGGRLVGALNKGYRHRENFDGIAGGDNLKKYGTYTNDEADRIRELKNGGFNTSANLKGGMPANIKKKIEEQAIANGLDPQMMLKKAAMESGGNPNAISSTGAIGLFQFVGRTATGVGITDRFDVDQNIAGAMTLTKQNQAALQKSGLPMTPENLYMMHQLGPKAAIEVINGAMRNRRIDQLSASTQDGVRKNYGSKSITAADYIGKNKKALQDRYNSVVAQAPSMPVNSVPVSPLAMAPASVVPKVPPVEAVNVTATPMSYTLASPDVSNYGPKQAPATATPIASNQKQDGVPIRIETPLGRDVADRNIAAVAAGGIGMQQMRV